MASIEHRIFKKVHSAPPGTAFTPGQFLNMGRRRAVDVALHRLAKAGRLRRIRQGLYDLPRPHPVLGATAPDPLAVARALMAGVGASWQPSGAYAANLLGLSEQVPAKIIILTDGEPRRVKIENLTLDFRRASPRNLLGAGRAAGLAIQALRHIRASGVTPDHLRRLRSRLKPAERRNLATLARKTPAWMHPLIARITGAA